MSVVPLVALASVLVPSGMMTARAVPTSRPAPTTDTRCTASSDMDTVRGSDPDTYDPSSMSAEKVSNCSPGSIARALHFHSILNLLQLTRRRAAVSLSIRTLTVKDLTCI